MKNFPEYTVEYYEEYRTRSARNPLELYVHGIILEKVDV